MNEVNAARFTELWGFEVPTTPGLTTGPMLEAAHDGEIHFLYNLGGNLLQTMPDPEWVTRAFGRVALRVHQDIVLNPSTLIDPGELLVEIPRAVGLLKGDEPVEGDEPVGDDVPAEDAPGPGDEHRDGAGG